MSLTPRTAATSTNPPAATTLDITDFYDHHRSTGNDDHDVATVYHRASDVDHDDATNHDGAYPNHGPGDHVTERAKPLSPRALSSSRFGCSRDVRSWGVSSRC